MPLSHQFLEPPESHLPCTLQGPCAFSCVTRAATQAAAAAWLPCLGPFSSPASSPGVQPAPAESPRPPGSLPGQRVGAEGLGLIAGISTQPFPNRTPPQADSEDDSKRQHSRRKGRETRGTEMTGRENEQGYRAQLQPIYCAGMVLVRGSLKQTAQQRSCQGKPLRKEENAVSFRWI